MILRRISEGIRQQDWFVVGVEILTVVVGIFIGLQVDDWNEERKERGQELVYLEKLKVDAEQSIALIGDWQVGASTTLEYAKWLLDLEMEDALSLPQDEFDFRIFRVYFSIDPLTLPLTAFAELVSAGELNIIEDQGVREQLLQIDLSYQIMQRRQDDKYDIFANNIDPYMIKTFDARQYIRFDAASNELEVLQPAPSDSKDYRAAIVNDLTMKNLAMYRGGIEELVMSSTQNLKNGYRELILLLDARIAELK